MSRNMRRKKKKKLICILTGQVANDGDDSYEGDYTDEYVELGPEVDEDIYQEPE